MKKLSHSTVVFPELWSFRNNYYLLLVPIKVKKDLLKAEDASSHRINIILQFRPVCKQPSGHTLKAGKQSKKPIWLRDEYGPGNLSVEVRCLKKRDSAGNGHPARCDTMSIILASRQVRKLSTILYVPFPQWAAYIEIIYRINLSCTNSSKCRATWRNHMMRAGVFVMEGGQC